MPTKSPIYVFFLSSSSSKYSREALNLWSVHQNVSETIVYIGVKSVFYGNLIWRSSIWGKTPYEKLWIKARKTLWTGDFVGMTTCLNTMHRMHKNGRTYYMTAKLNPKNGCHGPFLKSVYFLDLHICACRRMHPRCFNKARTCIQIFLHCTNLNR